MKTITAQEHEWIADVISEGLTPLAEAILEKDLLLTQALRHLASTDSDGVGLVFCGGTCLSKAHRLIDRMSEDVDFKLVVPEGLSRTARSKRISLFKKRVVAGDAIQFRNQYPEFEHDPVGQMRGVLQALHAQPDGFERDYLQFLDELVFGEAVSFTQARSIFSQVAGELLGGMN